MNKKHLEQILRKSRTKELNLRAGALKGLIKLLEETNGIISGEIARFSDENGKLRREQLQSMQYRISESLEVFKAQYQYILDNGIAETATVILERNGEIFIAAEGTKKLVDLLKDNVLAEISKLKEEDGLILSDRVWRLTEEAKLDIAGRLQKGILLGESHIKVAREIKNYVTGTGGLRYKSERLVLTEMAKAYKIANEKAVEQMRQDSDYAWFEKWELSPRHPKPDVCDILASQDLGEGPGVYQHAPSRHPGCLCYIYPVYRPKGQKTEFPTLSEMPIKTSELPDSQKKLAKELSN